MTGAPRAARPLPTRVRALRHRYNGRLALDGVDLELPPGVLLGVIGPDGVGKSTLLGLVAGERRIQEGSVQVLGHDMDRPRERRRVAARIAFLPQGLGRNLYGDLSVAENIRFFARLFAVPAREQVDRSAELLGATGLRPFADRLVRNLSGGMKQKLGLCCALVHRPDLLVLDEPTTGVDPLSRRAFWELVESIRGETSGLGVLVATSYMAEAEAFDRLVMLDAGRILAAGGPRELEERAGAEDLEDAYAAFLGSERPAPAPVAARHPDPAQRGVALAARDLTRRFGAFVAVDAVSFEVQRGEIFGFVGPNGCGKTTTMKMVTGILPPSSGEAFLLGELVRADSLRQRRRIGYMSQAFSLHPELSARENLDLHGRLLDIPRIERAGRIRRLAEDLGLSDLLGARAADLPLGHRQRLALAAATIHDPDVLVLDEPTSGVDPVARDAFWRLLTARAHDQGTTIFVSTHYLREAARCDRIALMNAGRLLAVDAPEGLVASRSADDLEDAFVQLVREDDARRPGVAA